MIAKLGSGKRHAMHRLFTRCQLQRCGPRARTVSRQSALDRTVCLRPRVRNRDRRLPVAVEPDKQLVTPRMLTTAGRIAGRVAVARAAYINPAAARTFTTSSVLRTMTTFYDLKADLPGGKTYEFDQLRGKVVLVVNVASQWCVSHPPYSLRARPDAPHTAASRRSTRVRSALPMRHAMANSETRRPAGAVRQVQGQGLPHPRLPVQPVRRPGARHGR
jgi:hypothetical protein